MSLKADTEEKLIERLGPSWKETGTGIFVRAEHPETGRWGSVDLVHLDKPSLLSWLRSRGGDNPWAEDTVGILLGHGHLHDEVLQQLARAAGNVVQDRAETIVDEVGEILGVDTAGNVAETGQFEAAVEAVMKHLRRMFLAELTQQAQDMGMYD